MLRLGDFDGRAVIGLFWASWCAHCRNELPVLERLQARTGGRLRVVAINVEERAVFRKLQRVLADTIQLVHGDDPGEVSAKGFGKPNSLPFTPVLRGDGSVASTQRGWGENGLNHLVKHVNLVLAAAAQGG